jgi:hypothetical protein
VIVRCWLCCDVVIVMMIDRRKRNVVLKNKTSNFEQKIVVLKKNEFNTIHTLKNDWHGENTDEARRTTTVVQNLVRSFIAIFLGFIL